MNEKTLDVLSVGLMFCDIIIKPVSKEIFDMDSQVLDTLKFASGGDAFNAAVNMSKLGLKVALAGMIGNDMQGKFLNEEAIKSGIDTTHIKQNESASTATSIVIVENNGERHFAVHGNANNFLTPECVPDTALESASIVHIGSAMALPGLEKQALSDFFRKAKTAGAYTSMDLTWGGDGNWLERIEDALYHTDFFMPSIQEAQHVSGLKEPKDMAEFFKKYGFKALVIKLGDKGCFITDYSQSFTIPAFNVPNAVDTTGAGDSFVSGFLASKIRGKDLYECGVIGNAVAAFCVQEAGATTGIKNWDETMKYIKNKNEEK